MIRTRPATSDDRSLVAVTATTIGAGAALAAFAAQALIALAQLFPACPLRASTGVPCPACGTGRAFVALLRGEPLAALSWNPLATLSVGAALAFVVLAPFWLVGRGPVPELAGAPPGGLPRGVWIAAMGALAAQWAYLVAAGR